MILSLFNLLKRKHKFLLTGIVLCMLFVNQVNAQSWAFRNGFGGTSAEKAGGTCIDASGNVYVTGGYATSINLGTGTLTSAGAVDGFVAKYNSSGVCQWSISFGSTVNDQGFGITTDGTNVYVTGTFANTMTLNATAYTSAGGTDAFVAKLNASTGATTWVTTYGGTSTEAAQAMCLDPSGNVYVSGSFFSTSANNFGSFSKTPTGGSGSDLYVLQMNSSGTITWVSTGGISANNDNPTGSGICYVPSLGEVVMTGGVNGAGTCTYGSVSFSNSGGAGNDIVLLEVNASTGAFVSGLAVGAAANNEEAYAACYDSNTGNVFFTGYYQSASLTFGSTTITNSNSSTDEIYYASYNPTTDAFAWAKTAGSANASGTERGRGICSNGQGGILITGIFAVGTATFGSSSITDSRTSGGEIFLVKVAASTGNTVWTTQGTTDNTTTSDNSGYAVATSGNDVWVAGLYTSNLTLGALSSLTSNTNTLDLLLGKFNDPALIATQSQVNLTCNGVCNGSATVVASGGTSPYTYSWAPSGGSAATASALCATNYTVTITDAASSSITKTFNITQPSAIVITPISQTNVSCNGGSNGAASLSASGGTGTLSYNWTPGNPTGDGTASVTGLTAGVWTCTVTDANACTSTKTFNITAPTALATSAVSQTNVSCNGGNTGSATISASGGTPSYAYSWAPSGGTGTTASSLGANTYTCTVTDANACTSTKTFNITAPTALATSAVSQTNVSCNGGNTGSATISVSGGTPSYTYSWAPSGGTGTTASSLGANTYTCTVTDANACTSTKTFNITAPTALATSTVSQTNVSCNGGNTGSATISVSGGTPSYTYSWAPSGGTAATASGLAANNYTCTVTDANGCTGTKTFNITAPTALATSAVSQTNVSCNGGSNGAATISVSGGTTSYSYNWTPGNPTGDGTASVTGLTAGIWTCTVTDANACTGTKTFNITAPTALATSAVSQTNVACNGGNTGSATISASGGTPSYTYSWAPSGGTGTTASSLSAGGYTCTVTDANGCTGTKTFNITAPAVLVASSTSSSILCNGGVASVTVSATGGTTAYTGVGTFTASVGSHTYTVTDANSCTSTTTVTITQPAVLNANSTASSILCNGGVASVTVSATGGTTAYTGVGMFTASVGSHTYTVTDANSCTSTTTINITQPTVLAVNSSATSIACNGGTATVTVTETGGTSPYSGDGTFTVTAGSYTYTVTDNNGCSASTNITVGEPNALVANINTGIISCNGQATTVTISASGGTPAYTGEGTFTVTAGSYTYTVMDNNGCSTSNTVTVSEPAAIISSQSFTYCAGGSMMVGPHTYSTSGTYTDVLTAMNGCDSTITTNLTINNVIDVTTSTIGNTITANATGASYQWVDCNNGKAIIAGSTNQSYVATSTGNYAVIVSENNCSDTSACVNIVTTGVEKNMKTSEVAIYPNPSSTEITIEGVANSTITIINSIGQEVLFINATSQPKQTIYLNNLINGVYFVKITSTNGSVLKKIVKQQ
jgi:hypothetical protein